MTKIFVAPTRTWLEPSLALAIILLAVLTATRLIGLYFSVVELFYDESQYWAWAQEPAFGYVSKPPLLAWVIAVADHICGNSEPCIRAPSPIFYFGTSLLVYAIARELYDAKVAFFAALSIGPATGVAFSARIISTDVPLLFFWSLALLAYVKLLSRSSRRRVVILGVSLGLGLLAKYAMAYFLLGVGLAAWIENNARRLLCASDLWIALLIATLLLVPNITWNIEHGLATLHEVGNNIQGDGVKFNALHALEFVASQFGVFGPVLFAILLVTIARLTSAELNRADRLMLAFAIPPLALITGVAWLTHANANWAATAFISGTVVAVAIAVRCGAWKWLAASIACGVFVQAALLVGDAVATQIHLPLVGDVYSRTLGWRSFAEQARQIAHRVGARSIVGDIHFETASLLYYLRDQPVKILAWPNKPWPEDNFELTRPLTSAAPQPILYVTPCIEQVPLSAYFESVEPVGPIVARTGPTTARYFLAFRLDGLRGEIEPRGECRW